VKHEAHLYTIDALPIVCTSYILFLSDTLQ